MTWMVAAWVRRIVTLDLRSLASLRIALGLIVLADALLRTRDATLMLAPDGMFPLATLRDFFGDPWAWSLAFLVDTTWWGFGMLALEGLAGAALAGGLFTRCSSIAAWVSVVSLLRRTAPATNAGDEWLSCLLFWGMFLPWGATWSCDAVRAGRRRQHDEPPGPGVACSPATAALVLQIAVVYLGAAFAKQNATWLTGEAVAGALSVHDHGTAWGDMLSRHHTLCRLLAWCVLVLESAGPCLLLATARPGCRLALVALFLGFHAATAVLMSLGLFAYVGMAAWLAILPTVWWDRWSATGVSRSTTDATLTYAVAGGRLQNAAVLGALAIAGAAFLQATTGWIGHPWPWPFRAAIRLTCLGQDWGMFGEVRPQRQWVYGHGRLADGRSVDVLRDGRPLEDTLPAGGFTSLPHHRWHKLFWELPNPQRRRFSSSVAAAIARDWNRRHGPDQRLVALEIRAVRTDHDAAHGTRHEMLLASWPARDAQGRGNLDRWLGEQAAP